MLKHEENDVLCRVGTTDPMGGYMRSRWLPIALGEELVAGGAPRRARLLAENVVAFRSPSGEVGVLRESCPHRGASLSLARNEECGLRCIYHGWKIGPDGTIVDTPSEPEDSAFKNRIRHISYPAVEAGGLLWTYLGEGDPPQCPRFHWMDLQPSHYIALTVRIRCNWAQALEGAVDSAHLTHLHSDLFTHTTGGENSSIGSVSLDGSPRLEIENTPYGFRYAAIRRSFDGHRRLVRISHFIAPCFALFAGPMALPSFQAYSPDDDHNTTMYFVIANPDNEIDEATRGRMISTLGMTRGTDIDDDHVRRRGPANGWLQDRAAMVRGETYTGIAGVNSEDQAVMESMGPIIDRTREHLGTTDIAVVRMRRVMIDRARRHAGADGNGHLLHTDPDVSLLKGVEHVTDAETRWQDLTGEATASPEAIG